MSGQNVKSRPVATVLFSRPRPLRASISPLRRSLVCRSSLFLAHGARAEQHRREDQRAAVTAFARAAAVHLLAHQQSSQPQPLSPAFSCAFSIRQSGGECATPIRAAIPPPQSTHSTFSIPFSFVLRVGHHFLCAKQPPLKCTAERWWAPNRTLNLGSENPKKEVHHGMSASSSGGGAFTRVGDDGGPGGREGNGGRTAMGLLEVGESEIPQPPPIGKAQCSEGAGSTPRRASFSEAKSSTNDGTEPMQRRKRSNEPSKRTANREKQRKLGEEEIEQRLAALTKENNALKDRLQEQIRLNSVIVANPSLAVLDKAVVASAAAGGANLPRIVFAAGGPDPQPTQQQQSSSSSCDSAHQIGNFHHRQLTPAHHIEGSGCSLRKSERSAFSVIRASEESAITQRVKPAHVDTPDLHLAFNNNSANDASFYTAGHLFRPSDSTQLEFARLAAQLAPFSVFQPPNASSLAAASALFPPQQYFRLAPQTPKDQMHRGASKNGDEPGKCNNGGQESEQQRHNNLAPIADNDEGPLDFSKAKGSAAADSSTPRRPKSVIITSPQRDQLPKGTVTQRHQHQLPDSSSEASEQGKMAAHKNALNLAELWPLKHSGTGTFGTGLCRSGLQHSSVHSHGAHPSAMAALENASQMDALVGRKSVLEMADSSNSLASSFASNFPPLLHPFAQILLQGHLQMGKGTEEQQQTAPSSTGPAGSSASSSALGSLLAAPNKRRTSPTVHASRTELCSGLLDASSEKARAPNGAAEKMATHHQNEQQLHGEHQQQVQHDFVGQQCAQSKTTAATTTAEKGLSSSDTDEHSSGSGVGGYGAQRSPNSSHISISPSSTLPGAGSTVTTICGSDRTRHSSSSPSGNSGCSGDDSLGGESAFRLLLSKECASYGEMDEAQNGAGEEGHTMRLKVRSSEELERYMDRRRRNNEAAKRCRANRRAVFEYRSRRAQMLEAENGELRQEMVKLNAELERLKALIAANAPAQSTDARMGMPSTM